jgi:hypothetical protein
VKVWIHVEDPGAANWMVMLVPELQKRGHAVALASDGVAGGYLAERGIACMEPFGPLAADFVLTGTSENLQSRGLAELAAARRRGTPSGAVIDQAVNAAHRFSGGDDDALAFAPDMLFVPDAAARATFAALGLADSRIALVGNPHHDRVRQRAAALRQQDRKALRWRLFPGADPAATLVLFASEVGYVVNPEAAQWVAENRFRGRGSVTFRSAVVLEELLDACATLPSRPGVVLRLHPKNTRAEFAAYERELAAVSAGGDPLEAVLAADLVVGMSSALLEDAWLAGARVMAVLPRPEEKAWLQPVAQGHIPAAGNREDLRRLLPAVLAVPAAPVPDALAGTASSRIAELIERSVRR